MRSLRVITAALILSASQQLLITDFLCKAGARLTISRALLAGIMQRKQKDYIPAVDSEIGAGCAVEVLGGAGRYTVLADT